MLTGFDEELAEIYNRIAQNNYHPQGPYPVTTQAVIEAVAGLEAPKILDLAAGMGEPAASIAAKLPIASVLATDASPAMIEVMSKKAESIDNLHVKQCDMTDLGFESEFDAVSCCYGYMFPDDKHKALTESLRALKPGGTLVATVWTEMPLLLLPNEVMEKLTGEKREFLAPPLNLAEPGLFENLVGRAGFTDLEATIWQYTWDYGLNEDDFLFKACMGFELNGLRETGKWDEAREIFEEIKLNYFVMDARGHYVGHGMKYKLITARRPSS